MQTFIFIVWKIISCCRSIMIHPGVMGSCLVSIDTHKEGEGTLFTPPLQRHQEIGHKKAVKHKNREPPRFSHNPQVYPRAPPPPFFKIIWKRLCIYARVECQDANSTTWHWLQGFTLIFFVPCLFPELVCQSKLNGVTLKCDPHLKWHYVLLFFIQK